MLLKSVHLNMILVTGGTGLLGAHLLYELVADGHAIRATYRDATRIKATEKIFAYYSKTPKTLIDQIEWVQADILDLPSLSPTFQNITQVYHCAALVSFDPKDDKALLEINVKGTENIVNLCIKHGIKKLCFASSIAAIGPSLPGKIATEENEWSDLSITTTYAHSKHLAEMKVWRLSQEGVPVVIVNPGVIIGPGFWKKGSGSFFSFAFKEPKYYLPGGTGFVSITDVVASMVQLMASAVSNERFILVSENLSFKAFSNTLAKALGKQSPSKELKHWMLSLFWRLDWLRVAFSGKRRKLSKVVARQLRTTEVYDNSKLKNQLDFEYGSLEETIQKCSALFLEELIRD